jgi:NTP pyrophosphatase (non-canonical NTP hydrolase)
MVDSITQDEFLYAIDIIATEANDNAHDKGFYDKPCELSRSIALMHSELSEALEADRVDNPTSKKIPEFSQIEEEFADVILRVLETSKERHYRIAAAVLAKHEYNLTRPKMHGGKKY